MINAPQLTADLRRLVVRLADDMDGRVRATAAEADLQQEHRDALAHKRTGTPYVTWRRERLTQAAVAWVLACTFVRFLEDNDLLTQRRLADGHDGGRGAVAHLRAFFADRPEADERHFLRAVFEDTAALPAAAPLFDRAHNPLWRLEPGADAGAELLEFWRKRTPDGVHLVHDFTDPAWDTRFLGDLYQDLSEDIRKTYALLQTPEFVESFILDHTLTPAIATFGYARLRLIDPTCGSGHFLLGAFARLLDLQRTHQPTRDPFLQTRDALAAVHGVDLNPYAVAVARFRLTVAALRACGVTRLKDAPAFPLHLAVGDSLLHGKHFEGWYARDGFLFEEEDPLAAHYYALEDGDMLRHILNTQYHAVVGNPPYITVKDKNLREEYKKRYTTCYQKYSLGVPFTERFFDLALAAPNPGYVGLITANSFMKREFGRELIESFFPKVNLTHVIDTSGAYIPGHGTPTVILFGTAEKPCETPIKAVMGLAGEPSTPKTPEQGVVWQEIITNVHRNQYESQFLSIEFAERAGLYKHPWTLSGGRKNLLLEQITHGTKPLISLGASVGITSFTLEDGVFLRPFYCLKTTPEHLIRPMVIGENIRDWLLHAELAALFPYHSDFTVLNPDQTGPLLKLMWPFRTNLASNKLFGGKTKKDVGMRWYEFGRLNVKKLKVPLSITFAFVATHNHFVLDRGGKVFKQSAPVIKLPEEADEAAHLALLGLLNSSTACFWMKQVCHNKGATSHKGVLQDDPEKFRFEFDGTKLNAFPIPTTTDQEKAHLVHLATLLDTYGRTLAGFRFAALFNSATSSDQDLKHIVHQAFAERETIRQHMVRLQEELDWLCYELYGLLHGLDACRSLVHTMAPKDMPPLAADDRPYRQNPLPAQAPEVDRARRAALASSKTLALLEKPEYKRRWFRSAGAYDADNLSDETLLHRQMETWLLDRIEGLAVWQADPPKLVSTGRLADWLRADAAFLQVATLYAGQEDLDLAALITRLVADQAVPAAAACRYKSKGLDVHAAWCRTWDLQRREDALHARAALPAEHPDHLSADALAAALAEPGPIPVPPKYGQADFQSPVFWRLRGKLDVPKERFVSYPQAGPDDGSGLLIGYAGWNHLQQAAAAAAAYLDGYEQQGLPLERLMPFLAALAENLPWLRQYHNDPDPTYGTRLGDYYAGFLDEELRKHGLTPERLAAWRPSAPARGRRKKREAP